jgi:hypothetical protein
METASGYLITIYLVYGAASIGLTVWLARTLFRNGAIFLDDVFPERPEMARAVNRLLVTGFYMANLGYAFLLLQANAAPDAVTAVEVLVRKLGILLVSLAGIHFVNLYVFYRIRRRAQAAELPPPVPPQAWGAPSGWAPSPAPGSPAPQ